MLPPLTAHRKLAMTAFTFLLGLGLVEGACWAAEWFLWGAPYAQGRPSGLYYVADGRRQLVPGARLEGFLVDVSINSWGFRDDEVLAPRPDDALRVWVVGGSTTFDIYARDGSVAWPNLLERRLQAALPDRTVEVLNAGIPGETMQGSLQDLEEFAERFDPHVVVLYHGPNDLRKALTDPEGVPRVPIRKPDEALQLFAFPRMLRRVAASLRVPPERTIQPGELDVVEEWLAVAVEKTRANRARPVLATHPLRVVTDDTGRLDPAMDELAQQLEVPRDEAVRAYDWYNAMIGRLGRGEGVPVARVAEAVDSSPENWGDLTHFRRAGSEQAADAVAATILSNKFLLALN